jgi:ATP-dependent exoDNAse (exonuclease V) alpha subunit
MSIFHLTVRSVSRASGRSAVAAAAYRAGERLTNDRDGRTHDYTSKPVVEAFILAPPDAPEWSRDRARLWNAVEVAEKRKDAKVAREYELALPAEVDAAERRRLAETFGRRLVERYGVAVDVAIHPPSEEGDQRNHHAHLLTTTRAIGRTGLGAKTRVLDVSSSASVEVEALREHWAELVNQSLAQANVRERVDHRSFERQGKAIEPTTKLGPIVSAIERRARARGGAGVAAQPVTERARFNALLKEMRSLSAYIERGRSFLEAERERFLAAAKGIVQSPVSKLRRAVGQIGWGNEHDGVSKPKREEQRLRSKGIER